MVSGGGKGRFWGRRKKKKIFSALPVIKSRDKEPPQPAMAEAKRFHGYGMNLEVF